MKRKTKLLIFPLLIFLSLSVALQAEIHISNYGYLPFAKKEAMLEVIGSKDLVKDFQLRDNSSDREKLKGVLDGPFEDLETGGTVYRINFTEQVRGGGYYLTVGDIKSSLVKIDSRAFNPVFVDAMKIVHEQRGEYGWNSDNEEEIILSSYIAIRGLSFYESFSDRFADNELLVLETEKNNKIPDFVDEMLYGVRGLVKWYKETDLSQRDKADVALVSSALAVAGRVLPKADLALAKEVAELATQGYNFLKINSSEALRDDLWLLLNAEMSLLTDDKSYEEEFRSLLTPIKERGWGPISSDDLTGFALGEMMKRSLSKDDEIYDLYMGRSVGLLINHEKDPYYRVVAYKPVEIEFTNEYLTYADPRKIGSEGLYLIDVNEYYRTNTWIRVAGDQMHYLLGRNRTNTDYLEDTSLETVFNIALLTANFKDSSTMTRSGQIVGGAFKITFYFVLIFAGITLWQKFSAKKAETDKEE